MLASEMVGHDACQETMTPLTWSDTAQWKGRLAEEVWITKHIHVLYNKPQQCHRRIDHVKFT